MTFFIGMIIMLLPEYQRVYPLTMEIVKKLLEIIYMVLVLGLILLLQKIIGMVEGGFIAG